MCGLWQAQCKHRHGGCDGGNLLAKAMVRTVRLGTRKSKAWLDENNDTEDYYKHEGYLYLECDYWQGHNFHFGAGAIWASGK